MSHNGEALETAEEEEERNKSMNAKKAMEDMASAVVLLNSFRILLTSYRTLYNQTHHIRPSNKESAAVVDL